MIFVTLGTQDKPFKRLLDCLEHSSINEEIIVQSGYTEYSSSKMKIFKYFDPHEFDKYINEADIVICHGGVGTIIKALKANKKVIACPRLEKYGEHTNDHQLQIVEAFKNDGYIIAMNEDDNVDDLYKKIKQFEGKKIFSNNEAFVSKLRDYIEQ